jgi:hypothetical protein
MRRADRDLGRLADAAHSLAIGMRNSAIGMRNSHTKSTQGLFRYRGLVLERLKLADFAQQTGEVAISGACDFGVVIQIGVRRRTEDERRDERKDEKNSPNPPFNLYTGMRTRNALYSRRGPGLIDPQSAKPLD